MGAGAVGAAVGSPADLVLVRMQGDGRLPIDKQVYKYANVADGLTRIVREEGVLNLWRGCSPTVVRYVWHFVC
jgi:solute carrier family 25 oxoglutarate transporter 11